MKKLLNLILFLLLPAAAVAQSTLRITSGGVAWLKPLSRTERSEAYIVSNVGGNYVFGEGGKQYPTATTTMVFDNTAIEENVVDIDFSRTSALVEAEAALADIIGIQIAEGLVEITEKAQHTKEITYRLRGTYSGSVVIRGNYKAIVELHGVNITAGGEMPALWVDNGKRIDIVAVDGTQNSFADAATNLKKAALFVKGHVELKGRGAINVTGNARHAYASNEYTWVREGFGQLVVGGARSDGLHIGQYLQMDGGTLNVSGTAGDAIDVEYTYLDEVNGVINTADEHNGEVIVNAGTISVVLSSQDTKALASDGHMTIKGGTLNLNLQANGTRGLGVGSGAKNYISNLLVEEADAAKAPVRITIEGNGTDSSNEKIRAVRVTGNATHNGGEILILLPGTTNPIKVDGEKTGIFAK